MPQATVQDMRDLFPLGNVRDEQISRILESSKTAVVFGGVKVEHEAFAELQILYAASVLQSFGLIDGNVSARSIGDVSVSFCGGASGADKDASFVGRYRALRANILGLSARIM